MLNLIAVTAFATIFLGLLAAYRLTRKRAAGKSGDDPVMAEPEEARQPSFLDRWEQTALQAGLQWHRNTYLLLAGLGLAAGALLYQTGHELLALAAAAGGLIGPWWFVQRAKAARTALFIRQLPGALFLASSVLRAGGTLLQAVESIAAEMPDPVGAEFRRIQQQMRLQVPAQEAFAEAQARVGIREFAAVVVAARITAEVGGNLAHIFDQISRSITEAESATRTVKAFTTEGRMSTNLIAALPVVVLSILNFLSPGYFDPMLHTWPGRLVLVACLGTILTGYIMIRRMVDIRMF